MDGVNDTPQAAVPTNDQRLTTAVEETFNFKLSGLSGVALPDTWKRLGSVLKTPADTLYPPIRRMLQPFVCVATPFPFLIFQASFQLIFCFVQGFKKIIIRLREGKIIVSEIDLIFPFLIIYRNEQVKGIEKAQARQQAVEFMRGIMDEFTHIANYSRPVDSSCIVIVTAKEDAYVPREGCTDLSQLWPGSELRYVPTGHVGAYVLHHQMFRRAVKDAFDKLIAKHYSQASVH